MYRRRSMTVAILVLASLLFASAASAAGYSGVPSWRKDPAGPLGPLAGTGILRYELGGFTINESTTPGDVFPIPAPDGEAFVTSNFGYRYNPTYEEHQGVDLEAASGTALYATHDGTVTYVKTTTSENTGRYIEITGGGWTTRYLHLKTVSVSLNQQVYAGDQIGTTGASGFGSETWYDPHLHFAVVRTAGGQWIPYDPIAFFTNRSEYGTVNGSGPYIPTTDQGDSNDWVRLVQDSLNRYYGYSLTVDGAFGINTKNAVQLFQDSMGLYDDGIVGPATWRELMGYIE